MKILFLGETYRADAQTWIQGIQSAAGVKIDTKELPRTSTRTSRMIEAIKFFSNLIFSREQYDISLAERSTSYGFFSLFVNAKVRVVAQQGISDVYPEHGFAGWYKKKLQKAIYKRAELIHAWGWVMTPAMLESGADPARILVKPKGLNLDKFLFEAPAQKKPNSAIVTRSLYPIYRHSEIIDAAKILKSKGIHMECKLIGDGELFDSLVQKSKDSGVEDMIQFEGRIDNHDLPDFLRKAQVYISVPETDGVSASLFEAMACGCFPIVTDLSANRAFIKDGFNGFLVPVGNVGALAEGIEKFLKSPEKYEEGIRFNRAYIEKNCDLKTNMEFFFTQYQKALYSK